MMNLFIALVKGILIIFSIFLSKEPMKYFIGSFVVIGRVPHGFWSAAGGMLLAIISDIKIF
ncbi:MAG: hypothetical protein K0Q75_1065 [Anaerospora sp.]|jgi:hypothetical protein|nr:hypothetical protein [Anaerospora sp.]